MAAPAVLSARSVAAPPAPVAVSPLAAAPVAAAPVAAASAADASWRGGWAAMLLSVVARVALGVLCCLTACALAPAVFGWDSTVVQTGSMQPRLHVGDVVIARALDNRKPKLGQVLLVDDPDHAGRLRLHRLVAFRADGTLTLRGDANPAPDSSAVRRSAVHGVAVLRVPWIGVPLAQARAGQPAVAVWSGLGIVVLLSAAFTFRPDVRTEAQDEQSVPRNNPDADDPDADDPDGADPDGADPDADDPEVPCPVPPPPSTPAATRPASHVPPAKRRRVAVRRACAHAVITVLVVGAWQLMDRSNAAYAGRTSNTGNSFTAASAFANCTPTQLADGPRYAWPLSEASGSTAFDSSANKINGIYLANPTLGASGPCGETAVTLNGTNNSVRNNTEQLTNLTALSLETWFRTPTNATGAVLIGAGTLNVGVTSNGSVTFAFVDSAGKSATLTSASGKNNNAWHHVVITLNTTTMALYVDGVATTATNPAKMSEVTGAVQLGTGSASNLTNVPKSYFSGSVANFAVYLKTLTSAQASQHYASGRP